MPSSKDSADWAVLGGGMLGLTLALRLAQRGQRVTLFEAAPALGGLTASFQYENVTWDRYYHVIESGDTHLLGLLDDLELGQEVAWERTNTNFYDGKTLFPLNNALDYLRLPALGMIDKLRLGLNIVHGARIANGAPLEQRSAEEWLVRWSGRRTFERLWRPLLRAKLGDNADRVSAAYIWAVMRRFYGAREGAARTELFGYVRGGYARVVEAFVDRLEAAGVRIVCGNPITAVAPDTRGLQVTAGDAPTRFDRVVVTFASPVAARLCHGLTPRETASHESIDYQGVICASLLLDRPLGGAYLTYITDPEIPFTTIIEMSTLVDTARLGGHHLVYLPKYVPSDDPLLAASDEHMRSQFMPGLTRMFPGVTERDIVAFRCASSRYVTALSTIGYSTRLPSMETSVPGLYICNSAQIVNASLSVNETVDLANRAATRLCA